MPDAAQAPVRSPVENVQAAVSGARPGAPNPFDQVKGSVVTSARDLANSIAQRGSIVIFIILALLTITLLIVFLVMKLRNTHSQGTLVVSEPVKLFGMTSQMRVEQTKMSPTVTGQDFSYTFWVYLVDFVPTADGPQLLFMRAVDGMSIGSANPIIALDGNTNTMYISTRTSASTALSTTPQNFMDPASSGYLTARVDYFPLQRWVMVAFVVKDDNLSLYLNNTLYTVSNVSELVAYPTTNGTSSHLPPASAPPRRKIARPVFSASTGSLYVGSAGVSGTRDARAYLSQLRFFGHALTPKDIASLYVNGPTPVNFLTRLGLSGYGLRSPIYRV